MTKCVFCGREENDFRGLHLIQNDGSISFYCSSKCRKNTLKLKRDRIKTRWTESYRIARDIAIKKAISQKSEDKTKISSKKIIKKTQN